MAPNHLLKKIFIASLFSAGLISGTSAEAASPVPFDSQSGTANSTLPATSSRSVTPTDVYARMAQVHGAIELIRFVMGKQKIGGAEIGVTGVAPREVYFQAITMFRKANRLSFEQTRELATMPEPPPGDIEPANVLFVVDAAFERIRIVMARLKITMVPERRPPNETKTPNDVFRAIVQANRQLNLMLDRRFTPSDVYQQVTLAVGYAARLRAHFPGDRIPEASALVVGRQPRDVYRRLLECYSLVRDIAARSGIQALEFQTSNDHIEFVTPSDVYDIASLIVSVLAYLHSGLDGAKPPRRVYYPGRKFPSHVDRRAGILQAQLVELRRLVADHPDWLRGPPRTDR